MKYIITLSSALTVVTFLIVFHTHATVQKKGEPVINKLLIIVLVQNIENRVTLEDELKYNLSDYGIEVVKSHETILKNTKYLTKEHVISTCKQYKINGVLVVKLVDIESENSYSYNQRSQYTTGGLPSATSSGVVIAGGSTYSWGEYAYGNYFDAMSSSRVEVQSDIHQITDDYTNSKVLFADDTRMRVANTEEAIGKFSKKLSRKILKQKILKTSK